MAASLGPSIVEAGLVLSLDAADKMSYKGSGTVWKDLNGNAYNTTLSNSPTFSKSNGGILTFERASTQYAETVSSMPSLSNWTIESWVNFTTVPSANTTVSAIITNVYNGSNLNYSLTTDVSQSRSAHDYCCTVVCTNIMIPNSGRWCVKRCKSPSAIKKSNVHAFSSSTVNICS